MNNYSATRNINIGEVFKITRPNGTIVFIEVQSINDLNAPGPGLATKFTLNPSTHNFGYKLNWHNCYSFGNGVESNRIKDNFNQPFLSPGVRVSTIFEDYKEENRTNGLIFSGLYNNISSINELNQFVQAENITKEVNPTYGSIQKLHARDSDLVVLCEDKVLKVVANKNALYSADGNPELTASKDVLGQVIPYIGEFGISKNPESFASEAYRSYFTDKQRGVVLRLSKDGLTPISLHGMKDYFKDNLKKHNNLIGSYDKKKDEYNIVLKDKSLNLFQPAVLEGETVLGTEELLPNGNFDSAGVGWEVNFNMTNVNLGNWDFSNNDAQYDSSGTGVTYAESQGLNIVEGKTYRITFELTTGCTNSNGYFILANHTVIPNPDPNNHGGITHNNIDLAMGVTTAGIYSVDWLQGSQNTGIIRLYLTEDFDGVIDNISVKEFITPSKTLSFNENVKGWTSFKSFTPENALGCSGDYYTFNKGELYKHHDESVDRNTFYGDFVDSSINVLLNDGPSHIKTFHTIDYEGSQSKITANTDTTIDTSYYNLEDKEGWAVESLTTDKEKGMINEFIEKEGKWFNYIKGVNEDINTDTDFGSSNIQGAGVLLTTPLIEETDNLGVVTALDDLRLQVNSINTSMQVGDDLYYVKAANLTGNVDPANIIKYDNTIGEILSTNFPNYTMHEIIVEQANYVLNLPELEQGDFIMFAKNKTINNSSISGYYADLEFKNNSTKKAELFAVASEISESSK